MNTSCTGTRRYRGFTLIELLITITIASILMAIAVPSFNRMTVSSRLANQTNELVSMISFTRSEAIKRNFRLVLCRASSATSTDCAGSAASWEHWIVLTAGGEVVRRGLVNTYGGALVLDSTLSGDSIEFGSDGMARTGGILVNSSDDDAHGFRVCSTRESADNIRAITLGAGSRITTLKESGTC
jgi:type IV fimbrial biogenesis protein FimT